MSYRSAAPKLMMLVRSGPVSEMGRAGPAGLDVLRNGRPSWAISSAIATRLPAESVK
jgi:hypothetical protein